MIAIGIPDGIDQNFSIRLSPRESREAFDCGGDFLRLADLEKAFMDRNFGFHQSHSCCKSRCYLIDRILPIKFQSLKEMTSLWGCQSAKNARSPFENLKK
ncbi:hypothetical protein TNCV_3636051 [Trichonephila clavipes]|nr:hypothetical protein TNCV_3636051 [Trichonephila clavipes]